MNAHDPSLALARENVLAEYPPGAPREVARLAIAVWSHVHRTRTPVALNEQDVAWWLAQRTTDLLTMPMIRRELIEHGFHPAPQHPHHGHDWLTSSSAARWSPGRILDHLWKPHDFVD